MDMRDNFNFGPTPPIRGQTKFFVVDGDGDLGPLARLVGKWEGRGFNVIWRPFHDPDPKKDHFLELNLTSETLQFERIGGNIPNRGLVNKDIKMFGMTYLQQISDANTNEALHIEPGIWATVPVTENPAEVATVVRMGSIPHGTTILAQGLPSVDPGGPDIPSADITPFGIGNIKNKITFIEQQTDLSQALEFRTDPKNLTGVNLEMVNDPNSLLNSDKHGQDITQTITLKVSTDPVQPAVGGGAENTAFLVGGAGGPNAQAITASSTFYIETVTDPATGSQFLQLQYTQTVLLNFAGLSWPHITVGTLRKLRNSAEPTIEEGDTGDAVRWLQRALRRTADFSVTVDGVFGATTTAAVKAFQSGVPLRADGIVGPKTWTALPEGGPMPTLLNGSKGPVVVSLKRVLTNGAPGQWVTAPTTTDDTIGADTVEAIRAFQAWAGVKIDGIVGDASWSASLHAAGATLESAVGLNFVQS